MENWRSFILFLLLDGTFRPTNQVTPRSIVDSIAAPTNAQQCNLVLTFFEIQQRLFPQW